MFDWLKQKYFTKVERNFNICKKLAELRTKITNSPQPQVRNLNCHSPQVRNFFRKSAIADLRTCPALILTVHEQ